MSSSTPGALRVRDSTHNWRIMYRIDSDVIIVVDVYAKKAQKIPDEVISRCIKRLKRYDETVKTALKRPPFK
ncbi:MAG: type II toxin-antitoxin system RelE/ParE family toxin [Planctomycetota bacterium]|nr:type II toxin-antitoxin system RelE/ParE family toxin [Planctomycetota bacterium]MDA1214194.1 type II toxin-antitoxin system RelE/ParE family toxin [Planctomycetota bacterium]